MMRDGVMRTLEESFAVKFTSTWSKYEDAVVPPRAPPALFLPRLTLARAKVLSASEDGLACHTAARGLSGQQRTAAT